MAWLFLYGEQMRSFSKEMKSFILKVWNIYNMILRGFIKHLPCQPPSKSLSNGRDMAMKKNEI